MALGFGVTPIATTDLLKLLEKQLKEAGQCTGAAPNPPGAGLGADAFLSLWPDQMHLDNPRSKRFVAIRPARFPIWQSIVQGSGTPTAGYLGINTTIGFNAVVTLACFIQINSDPEMRSANVVTEDVLSVTDFIMRVFKAVQFWQPRDGSNNMLLREYARVLDGGFGYKQVNTKDGFWCPISVDLELKYTAKF
jgi:hypothetical protein